MVKLLRVSTEQLSPELPGLSFKDLDSGDEGTGIDGDVAALQQLANQVEGLSTDEFMVVTRWVGNIEKRKKLVGWEVWENYVSDIDLEYRLLEGVIREKDAGAWELAKRQ